MHDHSDQHHTASKAQGWTMIELMMGVLLALLTIGAVVTLTVTNARQQRTDAELALALNACRTKIEDLRSMSFQALAAEHGKGFAVSEPTGSLQARPGDADGLPGRVDVQVAQSTATETLYRVTTTVDWTGINKEGNFSMTCYIGDRRR